jgi:ATP-dependent RNA helicase RhlE
MDIGRHTKTDKVDVKTVSDHPYPWHAGSPTASGTANLRTLTEVEVLIENLTLQNRTKKRWY